MKRETYDKLLGYDIDIVGRHNGHYTFEASNHLLEEIKDFFNDVLKKVFDEKKIFGFKKDDYTFQFKGGYGYDVISNELLHDGSGILKNIMDYYHRYIIATEKGNDLYKEDLKKSINKAMDAFKDYHKNSKQIYSNINIPEFKGLPQELQQEQVKGWEGRAGNSKSHGIAD